MKQFPVPGLILGFLGLSVITASSQTPAPASPPPPPATETPAGHDDVPRRYRTLVRPDRRNPAAPEMVGQRLPRELRRRPGLQRRVELAGDVRYRHQGPRSSCLDRSSSSTASTVTCVRCCSRRRAAQHSGSTSRSAASSSRTRSCSRAGAATTSATCGSARRFNLCVTVEAAASGDRLPRDGEGTER